MFQIVICLSALIDLKMPPSPPLISEQYVVTSENKMQALMRKMLHKIHIFLSYIYHFTYCTGPSTCKTLYFISINEPIIRT